VKENGGEKMEDKMKEKKRCVTLVNEERRSENVTGGSK